MLGCDRHNAHFLNLKTKQMKKIKFKIALLILTSIIVTTVIGVTHLFYFIFHN